MDRDNQEHMFGLEIDGRAVAASRVGAADPARPFALFVHGAAMDRSVWTAQMRELGARGADAVSVDLPGHGASEGPPLEGIADLGRWLVRLVDGLGAPFAGRRPVLCGHSMGSLAALAAAAELGDRLGGLVLVGSAGRMRVNAELLAQAQARDPGTADRIAKWSFGPASPAGLREAARDLIRENIATLGTDLASCDAFTDAPALAARIGVPAVLISGDGDRMTPPAEAEKLAAAFGDARFVSRPERGHMVMQEDPHAVSDLVAGLLRA